MFRVIEGLAPWRAMVVIAIAQCLATSALAQTPTTPTSSGGSLDLTVVGTLASSCGLGGDLLTNFADLREAAAVEATLGLSCNLPFELTVSSARGGLAHETNPGGAGGYSGRLDYEIEVRLPVRTATLQRTVARSARSDTLRSGLSLSSGDAISAGPATVSLSLAGDRSLLAGRYEDVITFSVTPGV